MAQYVRVIDIPPWLESSQNETLATSIFIENASSIHCNKVAACMPFFKSAGLPGVFDADHLTIGISAVARKLPYPLYSTSDPG